MKLTDQQRIAAKYLVAGYTQTQVGEILGVDYQTIHSWFKKKVFRQKVDFWRKKSDDIFETKMNESLGLVGDRLVQILMGGKDVDALSAAEKILRSRGKLQDKLIVESLEKEDPIDKLTRLLGLDRAELDITAKVATVVKGKSATAIEAHIIKRPREIVKDSSDRARDS